MESKLVAAAAVIAAILLSAGAAVAGTPINTVPEPMSLSLFAGGIGALAVIRFLRQK